MKFHTKEIAKQKGVKVVIVVAVAVLCISTASAQDTRYSNKRYGISFQPPPDWVEDKGVRSDVLVQYLGPKREDNTRPVINLTALDNAISLDEDQIKAIESDLTAGFEDRGLSSARVVDRKKIKVSGFDALQMDLTYKQGDALVQSRQAYVPIQEHKRTYLFTFSDDARHFDESSSAAESALNSFAAQVSRPPIANGESPTGETSSSHTLFLALIGIMALAVVVGAGYLLLRGRRVHSHNNVR